MRIPVATLNSGEEKLAELILYISQKSQSDPNFGETKLHKILFYSDFSTYGRTGDTITGAEYQHLPHGPAVKRMMPIQTFLKAHGALATQELGYFGFTQKKPIALRDPDLSKFSGYEIATVDAWIERLWDKSASAVSADSHDMAAWQLTEAGETIDPRMVFISWKEPTSAEQKRGYALAEKLGLLF